MILISSYVPSSSDCCLKILPILAPIESAVVRTAMGADVMRQTLGLVWSESTYVARTLLQRRHSLHLSLTDALIRNPFLVAEDIAAIVAADYGGW